MFIYVGRYIHNIIAVCQIEIYDDKKCSDYIIVAKFLCVFAINRISTETCPTESIHAQESSRELGKWVGLVGLGNQGGVAGVAGVAGQESQDGLESRANLENPGNIRCQRLSN